MQNNYDKVAGIYDQLAGLVFGKALIRSQVCLLPFIPAGSSILVAGGGTGWILEEIAHIHASGLWVTYVELSANMLAKAQMRDCKANQVIFVHQSVEDFRPAGRYDIIMTPFLFDNFSPERAGNVFRHLSALLRPDGLWLFTDFHYDERKRAYWQKIFLHAMLAFFRVSCKVEARNLNDMSRYFSENGFIPVHQADFFHHFIRSVAYKSVPHFLPHQL